MYLNIFNYEFKGLEGWKHREQKNVEENKIVFKL